MGRQIVEQPRGLCNERAAMIHLRPRRVSPKVDHGRFLPIVLWAFVQQAALPTIRDGQEKPGGPPFSFSSRGGLSSEGQHHEGGRSPPSAGHVLPSEANVSARKRSRTRAGEPARGAFVRSSG